MSAKRSSPSTTCSSRSTKRSSRSTKRSSCSTKCSSCSTKRSSPTAEIMPNVVKVLKLILLATKSKKKNSKPFHDTYSDIAITEENQMKKARIFINKCIELTNNALCSHRYYEASKCLWILCQDPKVCEMYIYRASMLVLENLDIKDPAGTVSKFLNEVQKFHQVNKNEIYLEYIIHGLSHGIPNVRENLMKIRTAKRKRTVKILRKHPVIDPILEAYTVYLDCFKSYDSLSDPELMDPSIARDAEKVIFKMYSLICVPGNWDIFVLKLVELLNRYELVKPKDNDNREEITEVNVKKVLSKYVEMNPDHLNAHIYLSVYLNENDPISPELIYHLKRISEMSPSDERVLILLQKLDELGTKLKKCFMFLDYPTNGRNLNAWNMLLEFLYDAKRRNDEKALRIIKTCWISRRKSWYWLHFNPSQVSHMKEAELVVVLKVKVLLKLDKDHEFLEKLFEKFSTLQELLTEKHVGIDANDESEDMVF